MLKRMTSCKKVGGGWAKFFIPSFLNDIDIEFDLTFLTYKVFLCKDVRSKFLGVRLLAVQSNTG